VLALLAAQFPLHIESNDRFDTTAGVYVCLLLLLSTSDATWLVVLTNIGGASISALVLLRRPGVRPPAGVVLEGLAFNGAQVGISIFAAGVARDAITARVDGLPAFGLSVIAASAIFYLLNNLAVATAIGLDLKRSPLQVLGETARENGFYYALLFAAAALSYQLTLDGWWGPLVMTLSAAAAYLVLRRRVARLEKTFAALEQLADSIDARDPYTSNHSKRVADYAVSIGLELGLSRKEIRVLRAAARVHDLGKAIVPPEVLMKEGSLSDEDWQLMKRHPEEGYRMLEAFSGYERGRNLVLVHHERYDGGGYPSGIPLRELHLLAQIIPVADTIDAMRSDRPYRAGLADAEVAEVMTSGRGTQWNPDVVDAALIALNLNAGRAAAPELALAAV